MKTTIKLDTCTYTLYVRDKNTFSVPTTETDLINRVSDVKALHAKCKGKHKKHVMHRANASSRIYPPNGERVSVREYCEQYYRANQYVFCGSDSFSKETLDFFEPLSPRRCYVQGEFSLEVSK